MYNKTLFLDAVKHFMFINHFIVSTRADRISLITWAIFSRVQQSGADQKIGVVVQAQVISTSRARLILLSSIY